MPAGEDRFSGRLLYPMHVLAVLPQRHRLSRRAVLEVAELAEEPLLRLAPGFASHGRFEAACRRATERHANRQARSRTSGRACCLKASLPRR